MVEEKPKEPKEEPKKEEVKKPITTLEEAKAERLLMQEQLDRRESIVVREEALQSERILGGTSEAGQEPVKETEDEKWAKDAKKRYEGIGMDPTPDAE